MRIDNKTICSLLSNAKRPFLARILEKAWALPINEYANLLWENSYHFPIMEIELMESFEAEFIRVGMSIEEAKTFSERLEKTRIIQTATHVTASEGATFLALHHLALLGMPPQETYFVGAYSGVSFSNSAWSGCLNYSNRFKLEEIISNQFDGFANLKRSDYDRSKDSSERRISLIPGNMRDNRVFQSKIPEKLTGILQNVAEPIRKISPFAKIGGDFSIWATQFCANQLRQIFKDKSIIYFDINEVIRNYLLKVLKNPSHPIYCMLFNEKIRKIVFKTFPSDTALFTVEVKYKNKIKHQSVFLKDGILQGKDYYLELKFENIVKELERGVLCPSLFLVFLTLSFINGMICFGSFEQVEYLADFRGRWLKIDLLDQEVVREVNVGALTSGRCIDNFNNAIYPLDLLLGLEWNFSEKITFGELLEPLLPRMGVAI